MEEQRFHQAAENALTNYAIAYTSLTFLGHSENVTFRVQTDHETYLLRIHFPVSPEFRSAEWRQQDVIESEFMWLQALDRDTPLTVPTAVPNHDGASVTYVAVEGITDRLPVTVLHWMEGESLDEQPTSEQVEQLGSLLAQLHLHASHWDQPSHLQRPSYDEEQLHLSLRKIAKLEQIGLLTSEDLAALTATVDAIEEVLHSQAKTHDNWGIIHADFNEGNYLFHAGDIRPIDFSSCGHGYFLFDLTTAFLHLVPANRQVLLDAYQTRRGISPIEDHVLETFFLWAIIDNFGILATNPAEHDYLAQDIPQVVQRLCKKYLSGERFLFPKTPA
ncbi:MAG: phosphotransferase enzyme family protein [Tumebacillaceae bacterium]